MILVTGASGKTGKTITKALTAHGMDVRAIVRQKKQVDQLKQLGAKEVIVADLLDSEKMDEVFFGTTAIYHICPNMHPQEEEIGQLMIQAAQKNHLKHFVYHSVLHPQVEAMPHHWKKMRVEDQLFRIKIPFTILQPAAYMQNVLGYLDAMLKSGEYRIPYSTSSRSSMIDLDDLAEVVVKVLTEEGHENAIYELSSRGALSALDVATVVAGVTGKLILAGIMDRAEWEKDARKAGLSDYAVDTLLIMFQYYEEYDFIGNSNQLTWLLGREPNSFEQFFRKAYNP
ncbi:MAG: nucleoside-diphosphate sugar epimerase [Chloroflexi bacterium HGW-Chloroflexi-3]|nr:MAG: nucleoside-diphosphate sugar epimerase [Chloroflexi bacterium HGW-Chloroflexi-3]